MRPVKWIDLESAFEFVSFSESGAEAFVQKSTGRVFLCSEASDLDELADAGIDDENWDGEDMIPIPNKRDLDLGQSLVFRFVAERIPDELDRVHRAFSRRGAYARFKDLLDEKNLLQAWYEFESEAQRVVLREWCEENGIELAS